MKNASHWVKFVLSMLLLCVQAPVRAAVPPDVAGFITSALPAPLNGLNPSLFQEMQDRTYQADVPLLGQQKVTVIVWRQSKGPKDPPESKDGFAAAAVLPDWLSAGKIVPVGADFDIGLDHPAVLYCEQTWVLARDSLPGPLKTRAQLLGMPERLQFDKGGSLMGKLRTGFVHSLLDDVHLDPNNLFVVASRRSVLKDPKDAKSGKIVQTTYSLSVIDPDKWTTPFFLKNTKIRSGTLRVTTHLKYNVLEAWGTVELGANRKQFSMYGMNDPGTKERSMGFDAAQASLSDFFMILNDVALESFGLPKFPTPPKAALESVMLKHKYDEAAYKDSSPPDRTAMMFQATLKKDKVSELFVDTTGIVFRKDVAKVKLALLGDGKDDSKPTKVNGSATFVATLGPLNAGSANLYVDADSTRNTGQMGVKVQTGVFGMLDLQAGDSGLQLHVPADCPLRPVGLNAVLTDLTLTDFPIKPELADCFSKELQALADGAEDAYKATEAVVGEVAKDSVETAEELGKKAWQAAESLHTERAAAWGKEIVSYAETRKTTREAAKLAGEAVDAAAGTIKRLGESISGLEGTISSLTTDIENLLKDAWAAVSGQLKKKRHDRDVATSQRDDARTQKAVAEARLEEAKRIQAQKDLQAANVPSPYVVGKLVNNQEALLGAQTQAVVQPVVKAMMANLPAVLKDPQNPTAAAAKRKEVLGVKVPVPCPGAPATAKPACTSALPQLIVETRKAEFASNPRKLSDLVKDKGYIGGEWLNDAKKSLISQALDAKLNAETKAQLEETVAGLPTMAYGVPVTIEAACDRQFCDNVFDDYGIPMLGSASRGLNQHSFSANGVVLGAPRPSKKCAVLSYKVNDLGPAYGDKYVLNYSYLDCDKAVSQPWLFFFDPLGFADLKGGLIRFMPPDATAPLCVTSVRNMLQASACPAPTDAAPNFRWRLKAVASTGKPAGAAVRTMAPGSRLKMPATAAHHVTNLAPLKLN